MPQSPVALARRLSKERFEAKLNTIAKAKPEPKMTISNEARLRVVLARAADAIEYLYGDLKRNPPPEGGDLLMLCGRTREASLLALSNRSRSLPLRLIMPRGDMM